MGLLLPIIDLGNLQMPAWTDRKQMRSWVALCSAEEGLECRLTILGSFRGL